MLGIVWIFYRCFALLASPKFFLNLRELIENLTARYTFQYSNYFRHRISRWKRYQYVNVIFRDFTTVYFKIKMARYLKKKLLHPWTDFINKNLFPVFRTPDQMILGFINRMACSFQTHASILLGKQPSCKPYRKTPIRLVERPLSRFSSPTKGRSIQAHFS